MLMLASAAWTCIINNPHDLLICYDAVEKLYYAISPREICRTRQISADVRQRAPPLPDILFGRVQCTENVWQERNKLLVIDWDKCPTGDQNVRQSIEGLPDILSGRLKIIFTRTVQSALSHLLGYNVQPPWLLCKPTSMKPILLTYDPTLDTI